MPTAYIVHIAAGSLGLLAGFAALYSSKGAPFHRRTGMVFVYSMLVMCAFGILIAAVRGKAPALNIPSALLTAGLIVTALTAVRPVSAGAQRIERIAMLLTMGIAVAAPLLGVAGLASGDRIRTAQAYPLFIFGGIAWAASVGDRRWLRGGRLAAVRIRRHLWRMSYALFVAAGSFFLGQAKVFPRAIRSSGLLPLPVLAVLATMLWWLWRTRVRQASAEARTPASPVPNAT